MKRSQYTDQQVAFALQQAEAGTAVPEVCRKMGVSEATFYRWKQKYGGLMPSEVQRLDFSRPGNPTDNAHAEAFNARFRAECLSQHWFLDLDDARTKVESWRVDYNEVRPHGAIGDRPPMALISAPEQPLRGDREPESLT